MAYDYYQQAASRGDVSGVTGCAGMLLKGEGTEVSRKTWHVAGRKGVRYSHTSHALHNISSVGRR